MFSPSENPIAMVDMKKENFIDLFILEGGKQKICFGNIDGTSKVLAFDFMEAEKRKDAEIVTKGIFEKINCKERMKYCLI